MIIKSIQPGECWFSIKKKNHCHPLQDTSCCWDWNHWVKRHRGKGFVRTFTLKSFKMCNSSLKSFFIKKKKKYLLGSYHLPFFPSLGTGDKTGIIPRGMKHTYGPMTGLRAIWRVGFKAPFKLVSFLKFWVIFFFWTRDYIFIFIHWTLLIM